MNRALQLITAVALCGGILCYAHQKEKIEAGPRGGRILNKTTPKAEFFVEKDRTVTIAFYDERLNPVPAKEQQVTVMAGKQKVEFEKKGDALASTTRLPEGDGYQIIVQYKEKPDAKPQNLRFKMDLSTCEGCNRAEYACTCH